MGCLNSTKSFAHWFGNIHLSGPCNRSCYFCIGEHMKKLNGFNNLDKWPLKNIDEFTALCIEKDIKEVNITGTNTDPTLYAHHRKLTDYLRNSIPGVVLGIRTNGISHLDCLELYDKGSFSITSFDPIIYRQTMGQGSPPNIEFLRQVVDGKPWKINICLTPFQTLFDLTTTINRVAMAGFKKVNVRELYGQKHIGDPFKKAGFQQDCITLGNPSYRLHDCLVTYWDVHYTEVESVNLYANGIISDDYPVTRGYHPEGFVRDQSWFEDSALIEEALA